MEKQIKNFKIIKKSLIVTLILLTLFCTFPNMAFAESVEEITWEKYEPCNELVIGFDKLQSTVIACKTTKNNPIIRCQVISLS